MQLHGNTAYQTASSVVPQLFGTLCFAVPMQGCPGKKFRRCQYNENGYMAGDPLDSPRITLLLLCPSVERYPSGQPSVETLGPVSLNKPMSGTQPPGCVLWVCVFSVTHLRK